MDAHFNRAETGGGVFAAVALRPAAAAGRSGRTIDHSLGRPSSSCADFFTGSAHLMIRDGFVHGPKKMTLFYYKKRQTFCTKIVRGNKLLFAGTVVLLSATSIRNSFVH